MSVVIGRRGCSRIDNLVGRKSGTQGREGQGISAAQSAARDAKVSRLEAHLMQVQTSGEKLAAGEKGISIRLRTVTVRFNEATGKALVCANIERSGKNKETEISDPTLLTAARAWLKAKAQGEWARPDGVQILSNSNRPEGIRPMVSEYSWSPPDNMFHILLLVDLRA
ncbi:MAG: hypothetical protein WC890_03025 [Candidatus Margulisiibacteriota bacterium]